ncbi:hypothetical protein ACSVC9_00740 [Clostridium sp. LBM24168]
MKKRTKIIAAAILAIVVAIAGYYFYQKYSLDKRVQTSDKMMKDKGIEQNNTDNSIVKDILKNDSDLEYAYISHNGETVMLNLKFKKSIQDKDKYARVSKYMDKLRGKYKGRNINAAMIPDN